MPNPMEFPKTEVNPQEEQVKEITAFLEHDRISSEELFVSYLLAMGSTPEELQLAQPPRREVFALAELLDSHMKNGLAANRIAGLVETRRTDEALVGKYYMLADEMKVTPREKEVLKSLVTGKRPGVVTVIDNKTNKDIVRIELSKKVVTMTASGIATALMKYLDTYKDKNISISFDVD